MIPQLLGNLNFATSPLLILLTEGLLISTVAVPGSVSAEAWPAGLYVIAVPSGMIATQLPSPVMLSITLTGVCPLNAAVANCSAVALASAVAGIGIGVPVPPMPEGRLPLAPSIEGGQYYPSLWRADYYRSHLRQSRCCPRCRSIMSHSVGCWLSLARPEEASPRTLRPAGRSAPVASPPHRPSRSGYYHRCSRQPEDWDQTAASARRSSPESATSPLAPST